MTTTIVETAARHLIAARLAKRPGARLPESARPADCDTALAVQRRVGQLLGLAIGGWKCSVPTPERPIAAAPIYAPTISTNSPCRIIPIDGMARIEPEIAFVMACDLPARSEPYAEAEVRTAIREIRLVLELIGTRYADPATVTYPELLADGIANQGLFLGPSVPEALNQRCEAFVITVEEPQALLLARDGKHPDGHPLRPLVWLANFLASRSSNGNQGLRAGQIVTTGSYAGVLDVPMATPLSVRFGELGTLSVQFSSME